MKKLRLLSCVTLAFALLATPVAAAPGLMNYSGRLLDSAGAPVVTPQNVKFTFWDAASGGNQLGDGYIYETTVTPNVDGLYAVEMGGASGTGGAIPAAVFDADEVWLNVNIGGEDLAPRARINSVGYAFRADEATTAATALSADAALHADHATSADHATNADHAATADIAASADEAAHALTADEATTATIAITALATDLATTASFAQDAAHAALSDHATSSDVSDNATTAGTSLQSLGLTGSAFVTAPSTGTAVQNGQALLAAYEQAKNLLPQGQPLSADNRAVLLVPPGRYDLTTGALVLDTEFVDVIGLSSARENQHIFGKSNGENTGVIMQTTNTVRLENLTVECTRDSGGFSDLTMAPTAYFQNTATTNTVLKNCAFIANDFNALSMRVAIEYAGHYENCTGGVYAFGGWHGTASGTFINCTGRHDAFGGWHGTASGTFINCTGGINAFGGSGGTASGTFTNCTGELGAFGGGRSGTASGTFTNCISGSFAFGGSGGTASGTFTNCTGGWGAFGGQGGTASGIFINCTGQDFTFGGQSGGTASGSFTNCTGGEGAFGGRSGIANGGRFRFCSGGPGSFGPGATETSFCIKNGVPIP